MVQFNQMLGIKDIFLTPVYILLFYTLAMFVRPKVTDATSIRYYIPALLLKFVGAIAMGLVYTFYYGAGDTTSYFFHASLIFDALVTDPLTGLELLFSHGEYNYRTVEWTGRMFWYHTSAEFMVARFAAVLGLITFCTYTCIALGFAMLSFSGLWAMFRTLLKLYPNLHRQLAIALFFLPSVFFWGSGLMKDSLCLGGLGWIFFGFYRAVVERRKIVQSLLIVVLASYPVLVMKSYILLAFMPPALFWIVNEAGSRIRNRLVRRAMTPFFFLLGLGAAMVGLSKLAQSDARFNLDEVAARSKVTSEYIYRVSVMQGGAAYTLGEMDGTLGGMLKLAPAAVNVSLFRPYPWEVQNPLMLLSAVESLLFLYLTITLIWRTGIFKTFALIGSTPILQMCFIFSIIFAMAVGMSTNNFGTLARYKVQMMPFYLSGLYIASHLSAMERRRRAEAFARA